MPSPLISIAEARQRVLDHLQPLETERVQVEEAIDRVLTDAVRAAGDVPPFPSSAMDGYAVKEGPAGRELSLVGESRAGAPSERTLGDGEAVRISTGAAVPAGATAVIAQENVDVRDHKVLTNAPVLTGDHIRAAGEVMRAGSVVLDKGTTMGPAELGAAVAAGAGEVPVARRPQVRILCTGDELREPGEPLGPGEIHNSNGPVLVALARRTGASSPRFTVLPDERDETEAALGAALDEADVLIVSGGVSVGPHDHVKPALADLGVQEVFWGVALQPGKPTWFGVRGRTLVFGLPGNPVSAVVTYALFARPAIAAMQGAPASSSFAARATLATDVRRNGRREQALRVRLEQRGETTVAIPNGPQDSHAVTSLIGADALALVPVGEGVLEAGTTVALEPLPN
jgi:molybdopterin molybdotransferase